ncbi:cleavage and polyadenylation specificity factor subunit 4 isoform 3 [Camelus ferus]|nr:cleavage and polyadenylation specificity factor subunit 4 isoform 3 [Camelus ferus]
MLLSGGMCPFRHISGEKTVVCKHWLRGLCKKGDQCEFLHEYDMTKMPECYFYSKFGDTKRPASAEPEESGGFLLVSFLLACVSGPPRPTSPRTPPLGECSNKECPFLHIDPESKIKDCPWYDRGFCKHGPLCRHRHTRRVICVNYLVGFCPEGPSCKFMHPRFELPMGTTEQPPLPQQTQPPAKQRAPQVIGVMQSQNSSAGNRGPRPLEQVTCYKSSTHPAVCFLPHGLLHLLSCWLQCLHRCTF